ncbi:MAG: GlsB/YeaQ/YmgE family stress response membrane protein [Acidobacteriota bacterium]
MHIIGMIIIGFIAGAVAKMIMPGKDPGGFVITVLLGIGGSIVANYLGHAIGWYDEGSGAGFIASVVGAILILAIYRMFVGRSRAA